MNGGIAKIGCDRVPAVDSMNLLEFSRYLIKRFVPADALPTPGSAADGMLQTVFVVVNVLESGSLRTNVTSAKGIFFVTADVEMPVGLSV